jgi:hypothetical protein
MVPGDRCGWYGDLAALTGHDAIDLAAHLAKAINPRGHQQFDAWISSLEVLRAAASTCITTLPAAAEFAAILEYQLPRDDRRPDAIVLENGTVVVIEFKESGTPSRAAEDQVRAYARDLRAYHSACHDRRVVPFLVPLKYAGQAYERDGVSVVPASQLAERILALVPPGPLHRPDPARILGGRYDPLPGIAHAARLIFQKQPLPRIRRADSAKIPDVHQRLLQLARTAASSRERTLVLLSGAPGSGKTLVGLQLVHSPELDPLVRHETTGRAGALFLSGNDPLVEVLQTTLDSRDFVQPLKRYLEEHITVLDHRPWEHVLVFDEAQRAWDAKKVTNKHHGKLGFDSEPELLLRVAERVPEWSMVVALIGDGQEIHTGEEAGLELWANAVRGRDSWRIVAPQEIAVSLAREGVKAETEPLFHLDTTLRAHDAEALHQWVSTLLDGDLHAARALAPRLTGFDLYVTRELDAARQYVRERYQALRDRRWGLLASSCAENLRGEVLRIKEDNLGVRYGFWYEGGEKKGGKNYCCSLERAVSEFGCQGLELDYAVLCWGDDLTWTGDRWDQLGGKLRRGAQDRRRLRLNAYRVLLTRGRDGMCIYVPRGSALDSVELALRAAGAVDLSSALS